MALIGTINVMMVANAERFNAGLASAQKSLAGFGKTANSVGFSGLTGTLGGIGGVARGAIGGFGKLGSVGAGAFGAITKSARGTLNQLGSLKSLLIGGIGGVGIWKVVQGAIALGEQTDRARIVFDDFSQGVIDQSKLMATAFGVSRKEFITSAGAFGTIFKGVGYTSKDAADLSVHFVKLATDLSSFAHIPVAEAMEKIQSGLAGQVRPLRDVGVMMSEEGVAALAAKMKIAALGAELTENQKVQARIAFITDKLKIATGNLAQTAGSAGNEVRSLEGRFASLASTIGTALLSTLGPALDEVNVGIQAIQMAWEASALGAASATVGVLGATQEQVTGIGWVQKSIGFVADAWQILDMGFYKVQSTITGGIIIILEAFHGLAEGIGKTVSYFTGMQFEASSFAVAWIDDLKRIRDEQDKTFNMKLAAPVASETINAAFDASRAKIQAARDELLKSHIDVTKIKPAAEDAKKGHGKFDFGSALVLGSKEASSSILRSQYGMGAAKPDTGIKSVAKNTTRANDLLSQLLGETRKMVGNLQPFEFMPDLS
jgi:hypothetical protein